MNLKKTIFLFFLFLIKAGYADLITYENKKHIQEKNNRYVLNSPSAIKKEAKKTANYKNKKLFSKVKLVSPYQSLSKQTKKISIGLWVTLNRGWHSYWQNPGESGKSLKAKWTLPDGSSISHLNWPIPERLNVGSLTSFVYKNHFLLISELLLPKKKSDSQIRITAQVEWFICEKICIPMNQEAQLTLSIREKEEINPYWWDIFDKWSAQIPQSVKKKIILQDKETNWQAHISTEKKLRLIDVFPLSKNDFSPKQPVILSTDKYQHSFLIKSIREEIATQSLSDQQTLNLETKRCHSRAGGNPDPSCNDVSSQDVPFFNTTSQSETPRKNIRALAVFKDKSNKLGFIYTFKYKKEGIFWFLLLAFLGGLILNFMPCVLPIVFLKFSNTLEQSRQKTSEIILGNLFYSTGVILSFMLLAFLVVFLKKGGDAIGWGFQMQSPYFLLSIIFLFVLVSFNFMGWFSLSLPSIPFFHRGKSHFKHFLTGILSTTAASPCTVPFMGAAIGYAFSGNVFQIMTIFLFLGLGLSFPYLLLSAFPRWIQHIPTPGSWSNKLKHFMAFPMLITSIWLIHLFNQQQPENLLPLLLSLIFLAFGFWLLNNIKKRTYIIWLSRAIILSSLVYPFLHLQQETKENNSGIQWETFSLEKMEKIHLEGQALFINFTADWCLTCKFNKQITFKNKTVIRFFADKQIRSLKGDWTNKNPEISAILKSYHRSGIPFYLYIPPDSPKSAAVILPELLTPGLFFKYMNNK